MPSARALLPVLLAAGCAAPAPRAPEPPPNLIVILADDLGQAELGCYGQERIRTPCIDRLAAEGLRFTQYYAGSPLCAPSRCTLLTGLHTGHAAIRDNLELEPEGQQPLPAGTPTLAALLRAAGYRTACIGKWGLGGPGSEGEPGRHGFEHVFGYLCQRAAHDHYPDSLWRDGERVALDGSSWSQDLFVEDALAFVRAHREEPFFLYLALAVPHLALQVPEEALAEYRGLWEDPPYDGSKGYRAHPTPRAAYAAMVTRMDRDVGRLVELVDALGLGGRTLVLFASDNGPTYDRIGGSDSEFFASAGGLRGLKGSVHEGGIRSPLVARWSGRVAPGRTSAHLAASWDLLPTLCELARVEAPPAIDGLSFAPTLLGRGRQPEHLWLYWELASYGGQQAVRFDGWKAVRRGLGRGRDALELYDLAHDPAESRDLAPERPAIAARARRILAAQHAPSALFPLPLVDAAPASR